VSTGSPASRHDLTDAQWAVLVPLLPPTGPGPPTPVSAAGAWSTVRATGHATTSDHHNICWSVQPRTYPIQPMARHQHEKPETQ
jgi:transposase